MFLNAITEVLIKLADYGIPEMGRVDELPTSDQPKIWNFSLQLHEAERAGAHYDLRLGDPSTGIAHSWVVQRLPEPGEKILAVRQSSHTEEYMGFSGEIPQGYGKGKVKSVMHEKVEVLRSFPGKISFLLHRAGAPVRYTLVRAFDDKNWLLVNHTPTRKTRSEVPNYKAKYKEIDSVNYNNPNQVFSEKIDGAHGVMVLRSGKYPEVFSYRDSKKSDTLIDHTFKLDSYKGKVSPVNAVIRGELYAVDEEGRALPSTVTSGLLNSETLKARKGPKLQFRAFDLQRVGTRDVSNFPYNTKLTFLDRITKSFPGVRSMKLYNTPEDKKKLVESICSGENPLTSEGIVVYNIGDSVPQKLKFKKDMDLFIKGFFDATAGSKYENKAVGGIIASFTEDGLGDIYIGSGISDELRKKFYANPNAYIGKKIKVEYQDFYPETMKLRMPVFKEFREWQ